MNRKPPPAKTYLVRLAADREDQADRVTAQTPSNAARDFVRSIDEPIRERASFGVLVQIPDRSEWIPFVVSRVMGKSISWMSRRDRSAFSRYAKGAV